MDVGADLHRASKLLFLSNKNKKSDNCMVNMSQDFRVGVVT